MDLSCAYAHIYIYIYIYIYICMYTGVWILPKNKNNIKNLKKNSFSPKPKI